MRIKMLRSIKAPFSVQGDGIARVGEVYEVTDAEFKARGQDVELTEEPLTPVAQDTSETPDAAGEDPRETVDSLVEDNTKDELLALAAKRKVDVSDSLNKHEIAEKIIAANP